MLALLTSGVVLSGCAASGLRGAVAQPPTAVQLQAEARAQQAENRAFVDALEARLASPGDPGPGSELQQQLRAQLEGALAGTRARLLAIGCAGAFCKVEIAEVAASETNTVVMALATAQSCAMPMINLSAVATQGIVSAYVDCEPAQ